MNALRFHMDFESRSILDIKMGEHMYARHPSTAPLMLSFGAAPKGVRPKIDLIDFFGIPGYAACVYPFKVACDWTNFKVPCPPAILEAIARGDVFVAHNARFEQAIYYYICHLQWGWPMPARWSCTAARSRYFGIRASLEGSASDLEVIAQKDARGKEFINEFCKPRKYHGTKAQGRIKLLWSEPHENPAGYQAGKEYCVIDGEAEADVDGVLPDLPPFEQSAWEWDFKINTRGVPIDIPSVKRAIEFSDHYTAKAYARFDQITSLRPTQRDRVLEYLQQRDEIENLGDLKSKTLTRLCADDFPDDLKDVIQIRLDCSLASPKKLWTMVACTDTDGVARGGHLYGGAHTMRWSHKRIQTGNMKRGNFRTQAHMFEFLTHDVWGAPGIGHNRPPQGLLDDVSAPMWVDAADWRFLRPLSSLSQSMRGFVAAPKGKTLRIADFSQIEARVLAWLARCMWLLEAFRAGRDPYVTFASGFMYHDRYEDYFDDKGKVRETHEKPRHVAKQAVLGAGFGIGGPKFREYCDSQDIFISEDEAKRTVDIYRDAHPEIVQLWARMEAAAIAAVNHPGNVYSIGGTGVKFYTWYVDEERYWLCMELPSGRCMHYYRPKIELRQKWGRLKEVLTFRTEWNGKSYREDTYGGKITENAVQAIARDCLVAGGINAENAGYPVIMLVHDETVTLCDEGFGSHQDLCARMCALPPWITDLPVAAEGKSMQRYGK